jgi:hypothetical protein
LLPIDSSLRDNLRQLWREKERQLQGMLSGRRNRPPRRSLFDLGDDYGKDEKRLVILNSAPSLTFEKKGACPLATPMSQHARTVCPTPCFVSLVREHFLL